MSEELAGIRKYMGEFPEHDQCDIRVWLAAEALAKAETGLERAEACLINADGLLDGMAIAGIKTFLPPPVQQLYAATHTAIRQALAAAQQEQEDDLPHL